MRSDQFANETCLIEADREREKERLTYREFQAAAQPLARALQDADFRAADRAAIIMTNQSKWLISAYAIFFCGGVLVPLDYKLTPDEQWQLLTHSGASVLVTEYPIWRQLAAAAGRSNADESEADAMSPKRRQTPIWQVRNAGKTRWRTTRARFRAAQRARISPPSSIPREPAAARRAA